MLFNVFFTWAKVNFNWLSFDLVILDFYVLLEVLNRVEEGSLELNLEQLESLIWAVISGMVSCVT